MHLLLLIITHIIFSSDHYTYEIEGRHVNTSYECSIYIIYICFVRIVCICTLSWLLMHAPVVVDASYIYRVYYKYQEQWNLTTRLYFYSWRKTLGAFMEAMSSYITRHMETRMDVALNTTTVRASKSYFVLHYKYIF